MILFLQNLLSEFLRNRVNIKTFVSFVELSVTLTNN
jgi:hypothetical protein